MLPFVINQDAVARPVIIEIGDKKEHRILIIDDFFKDPDMVRETALDPQRSWITPKSGYPGQLSFPAPGQIGEIAAYLVNILKRQLRETDQIQFSMVTRSEAELNPLQRRPHFDGLCFGGLIYLNPPDQCQGGTGYFRHKATGISRYPDQLTPDLNQLIAKLGLSSLEELQKWLTAPPSMDSAGYITETNSEWERIGFVEMKYNRFIIYDGQIFHSAVMQDSDFGSTPGERRLTLNIFADRD